MLDLQCAYPKSVATGVAPFIQKHMRLHFGSALASADFPLARVVLIQSQNFLPVDRDIELTTCVKTKALFFAKKSLAEARRADAQVRFFAAFGG